jgi:hypothetical protein
MQAAPSAPLASASAPVGTAPVERVIAPPRGSLAAGRWEARPITIWAIVVVATVAIVSFVILRRRHARIAARRRDEARLDLGRKRP